MNTQVVNIKKDHYDIYIGRSKTKYHFGNPFSHLSASLALVKVSTLEESIKAYSDWLNGVDWPLIEQERRQWILDNLHTLSGKRLGCFCKPNACHGDVLAAMADTIVN